VINDFLCCFIWFSFIVSFELLFKLLRANNYQDTHIHTPTLISFYYVHVGQPSCLFPRPINSFVQSPNPNVHNLSSSLLQLGFHTQQWETCSCTSLDQSIKQGWWWHFSLPHQQTHVEERCVWGPLGRQPTRCSDHRFFGSLSGTKDIMIRMFEGINRLSLSSWNN